MSHKQICGSVHQHISGQLLLHQTTTFCCVVDIIPAGYITLSAARNIPADTDETPWKRHRFCTVQNNVASSSLYEPRSWFSSKQMLYTDALLTSYRDKKKKNETEAASLLSIKSVQPSKKKTFQSVVRVLRNETIHPSKRLQARSAILTYLLWD